MLILKIFLQSLEERMEDYKGIQGIKASVYCLLIRTLSFGSEVINTKPK